MRSGELAQEEQAVEHRNSCLGFRSTPGLPTAQERADQGDNFAAFEFAVSLLKR